MSDPTELSHFIVCDAHGAIVRTGQCAAQFVAMQAAAEGEVALPLQADASAQYFDIATQQLVQRLTMSLAVSSPAIAADGEQACVISGVPDGTMIFDGFATYVCDDGVVEFSTTAPGLYEIELHHFRYLVASVAVTAT